MSTLDEHEYEAPTSRIHPVDVVCPQALPVEGSLYLPGGKVKTAQNASALPSRRRAIVTEVLVVDDDDAIRETLRSVLEDAGYSVLEAHDGLAAIQRLRRSRTPMVVLLDLMMPGLDGAGVLKEIAGDSHLMRRFAFVLVTASHKMLTPSFVKLLSNLSIPIITKPWDIDYLLKAVASAAASITNEESG
jgi:CheY-like chemotaxis protein